MRYSVELTCMECNNKCYKNIISSKEPIKASLMFMRCDSCKLNNSEHEITEVYKMKDEHVCGLLMDEKCKCIVS
mgnify:FL=1